MRFILILLICLTIPILSTASSINVPDDYSSIQGAINASITGDSILIAIGTYYENIVIDKTITLIGQSPNCTIIEGDLSGNVITIVADGVVVKKITATGAGEFNYDGGCWDAALKIDQANHCLIESCYFKDNITVGLVIAEADSNIVRYCNFTGNYSGMMLCANFYPENPDSISEIGTIGNQIRHNHFVENSRNGIDLQHTYEHHLQNIIYGNLFSENLLGLEMIMSQENEISSNSFIQNSFRAIQTRQCSGGGNDNLFHNNAFIESGTEQVSQWDFFLGSNFWFFGDIQQGNFWSDYEGVDLDLDGIGDTPVDIYGSQTEPTVCQDMYPLMQFDDADSDGVMDVVDNCPNMPNPDQRDENLNGIGDVCDLYIAGDANTDLTANVGDAVYLINFVFKDGSPPVPIESGDANLDNDTNVGDAVYLINFVFKSGPPPCCP